MPTSPREYYCWACKDPAKALPETPVSIEPPKIEKPTIEAPTIEKPQIEAPKPAADNDNHAIQIKKAAGDHASHSHGKQPLNTVLAHTAEIMPAVQALKDLGIAP